MSFPYYTTLVITLLYTTGLLLFPSQVTKSVIDSISLCLSSVIPSLFPFLISANLIINMRFFDFFGKVLYKLMPPLFSVSGSFSSALILGMIGGYPVGGITVSSLYKSGKIAKKEAEHALAFCNNCGPAFILGAIGNSLFHSSMMGFSLYLIHILGAIFTGLVLRLFSPVPCKEYDYSDIVNSSGLSFSASFTDAVFSSLKSILLISAYIIFFSVFVCLLNQFKILSMLAAWISNLLGLNAETTVAFLTGIFEMTSGIFALPSSLNKGTAFSLTAFLLGWGGFSVHFQTQSALSENKFNFKKYYMGKLLHGAFSLVFALIFFKYII